MVEKEIKTDSVVVVGMNLTRLLKIMAMVNDEVHTENDDHVIEYVPCIAAMASYKGENGGDVRYLSNFIYHDGSPMNQFFDDEGFRESLKKVVMVGYEWKDSDDDLIKKYFEAFRLLVEIACVKPNSEFSSLDEEMQHFKNLTPEQKAQHSNDNTMGPKKMKQFIFDSMVFSTCNDTIESATIKAADAAENEDTDNDVGEKVMHTEKEKEEPLQQRTPQSIDSTVTSFACRMCRTILLTENHLSEEVAGNQHTFKRGKQGGRNGGSQSLFCDESVLDWLTPEGTKYDFEGKLTCPNCSFKVGHWNWSGACYYGTWVVPAIQIPLGKIDVVLPEKERHKASSMIIVSPKQF